MAAALLTAVSCGGPAGGSDSAFCEDARDRADALEALGRDGTPDGASIGALRDLAADAPADVRDDIDDLQEGESQEDVLDAARDIARYLREECDLDV